MGHASCSPRVSRSPDRPGWPRGRSRRDRRGLSSRDVHGRGATSILTNSPRPRPRTGGTGGLIPRDRRTVKAEPPVACRSIRPGNAARRIRTCNQGIRGPPRFRGARTISPSPPPASDAGASSARVGRPGALGRGLSLGLTPLVSEPSWPPEPGQAWLRIAVPGRLDPRRDRPGLGSPQFTRIASGGRPPAPPFSMSPLLCR